MPDILVIEDDRTFSRIVEVFLSKQGYAVTTAHTGSEGLQAFDRKKFQLVLLDYRLPDSTGMEILNSLRERSSIPVIIMTSFSDVRTAVKAIKAGAFEYITKPVNPDELSLLIRNALQEEAKPLPATEEFVQGRSERSLQLQKLVDVVAPSDLSVIIEGESGTGKEYVARAIHNLSSRKDKPFVAVDCGVLSKELATSELFGHVKGAFTGAVQDKDGQFLAADGGTLFLDEVGNLGYEVQVQLLRAIQQRSIQPVGSNRQINVNVRIITATNDDLSASVKEGKFREDLYHRLNEFKLFVSPLRERPEDLEQFVEYFIRVANRELSREVTNLDAEVWKIVKQYEWPGNLRELRNTIRRAVLLSSEKLIRKDALPAEMVDRPISYESSGQYDLKALQERNERELILKTLADTRFNKSKTARLLNIDRKTLYLKMEKYGIE